MERSSVIKISEADKTCEIYRKERDVYGEASLNFLING